MSIAAFLDALEQTYADVAIVTDTDTRQAFSQDVFFRAPSTTVAVLRPKTEAAVKSIAAHAEQYGVTLRVRGGGLSYSGGYIPRSETDVMVDMSGLNAIVQIDRQNMCVTVEAGCTWQSVREALLPQGLEVDINAPVSGSHSTIGGGISQGLPGDMSAVLSVGVVLPNGRAIRTGSAGTTPSRIPFNRHHGPDLTGLFIGDCGTYGIKTHITLRARPILPAAHACFVFPDITSLTKAAAEIGPTGFAQRCMGLDPSKTKQAQPPTLRETASVAWDIVRLGGIAEAVKVAAGSLQRTAQSGWTLHITTTGATPRAARDAMSRMRQLCAGATGELSPVVARALHAQPFSVRGSAGRTGEAWVPVHGILPPGRAVEAARALEDFLQDQAAELGERGIDTGVLISAGKTYVLIEPMLLWPDTLTPVVANALGADRMKRFKHPPASEQIRQFVMTTRKKLRDLLRAHDATFLQLGEFYALDAGTPLAVTLSDLEKAVSKPLRSKSAPNLTA